MLNLNATTTTNQTSLSEISEDIKQLMAEFFPQEALPLALVSKEFYKAIMKNSFWNQYLKEEYQVDDNVQSAFKIFTTNPEARKSQYTYLGKAGKLYLEAQIEGLIAEKKLTEIQIDHLRSGLVFEAITQGKLSLEEAIARSSDAALANLEPIMLTGIRAGLTREQVEYKWFDIQHTIMIEAGFSYADIQGLNLMQLDGLCIGLTREQVNHNWYSLDHTECLKRGKLSYAAIKGLTIQEVWAKEFNLTLAQVTNPYFSREHLDLIIKGYRFNDIIGLNTTKLLSLHYGLSLQQVTHPRFTAIHRNYYLNGYTYEQIKDLSIEELYKLPEKPLSQQPAIESATTVQPSVRHIGFFQPLNPTYSGNSIQHNPQILQNVDQGQPLASQAEETTICCLIL